MVHVTPWSQATSATVCVLYEDVNDRTLFVGFYGFVKTKIGEMTNNKFIVEIVYDITK